VLSCHFFALIGLFLASRRGGYAVRGAKLPPGADASVSTDASCRTPCSLAVPLADAFTVSYALTGYLPQTVPVRPLWRRWLRSSRGPLALVRRRRFRRCGRLQGGKHGIGVELRGAGQIAALVEPVARRSLSGRAAGASLGRECWHVLRWGSPVMAKVASSTTP
jgi:hypothetical protein